jgi:hypothetical protein
LPGALSNLKKGPYEKQKILRYALNPDAYAKRTAVRIAEAPAAQSH